MAEIQYQFMGIDKFYHFLIRLCWNVYIYTLYIYWVVVSNIFQFHPKNWGR